MLEFRDEILVPRINGRVYFAIYELETWLRRICLSAYMGQYGVGWVDNIPSPIGDQIKRRMARTEELYYLDADSDDNIFWSATYGELCRILLHDNIWPQIEVLTKFSRERLSQKLDEIRDIRNLLAHNRAFSGTTVAILEGLIASMRLAIDRFKGKILYGVADMSIILSGDPGSNEVTNYFNENCSTPQAFVSESELFNLLACLPDDREGHYPSAAKLLHAYGTTLKYVVAFLVNKAGDEYLLLLPKALPLDASKAVINVFLSNSEVWADTDFENQNPKYICNPKIWFYENEVPVDE